MEATIDAFDARFDALFSDLTRLLRALGAGARAEDLAQEALIFGRGHLEQLRDADRLQPWLRTIAVRSLGRARSGPHTVELAAEPVFLPVDRDLGLDASAAVTRLPARERVAVTLVFGLGYRQEEAAELLGITRGGLAASLWKARQRLARDLADYREGPRR